MLIWIFGVIYAIVNVGDYKLGIAQTSSDDGLLAVAFIHKNKQNYLNDHGAQGAEILRTSSIMHHIPSLMFDNFNLNPEIFWVLLTYFQNIFFVTSIYFLAKTITRSSKISVFVVLMAINLRIQTLNLAWIGDLEWMPYGTWISLPIQLYAFRFILNEKFNKAIFLQVISILVHPTFSLGLTLYMAITFVTKKNYKKILLLLFPFFYPVFNYLRNRNLMVEEDSGYYIKSLLENPHINSIQFDPNRINFGITSISLCLILSLALLVSFGSTAKEESAFKTIKPFRILSIIMIIFITVSYIGLLTSNVNVMKLNLQRFSIILIIILLIYAINIIFTTRNKYLIYVLIPTYILIFITSNILLHIIIALLWLIYGILNSKIITIQSLMVLWIELWIMNGFMNSSNILNKNVIEMIINLKKIVTWESVISGRVSGGWVILWLAIMILFIRGQWIIESKYLDKKILASFNVLLILFLSYIVLQNRYLDTKNRENPNVIALADIQKWARDKSNPNDYFMVDNLYVYRGWRNATNRPVLSYMSIGNGYFQLKSDIKFNKLYEEFFKNIEPYSANGITDETSKIQEFGHKFGASYIVWKKEWVPLNLKLIYKNDYYNIYDIRK
jgi:hypothetical protein